MSNTRAALPSFGMRRRPNRSKINHEVVQEQEDQSQTVAVRTATPVTKTLSPTQKTPPKVNAGTNTNVGTGGVNLKLNDKDSLLYYNNGKTWVPLAIVDDDMRYLTESLSEIMNVQNDKTVTIEAPPRGNIHLKAGNNPPGGGGHVTVAAGHGGLDDGEIYFTVGGEKALTITKNSDVIVNAANIHVETGDIVVKSGNIDIENPIGCINSNISRQEITVNFLNSEVDGEEEKPVREFKLTPDAILNSMTSVLTVNADLEESAQVSGIIKNSLIKNTSWVNITASSDSGCPYVWVDSPENGQIKYTIKSLAGNLKQTRLFLEIRNSN